MTKLINNQSIEMKADKCSKQSAVMFLIVAFIVGLISTGSAMAATVSVSATANGGPVSVTASATFTDGAYGALEILLDDAHYTTVYGTGTASWTGTLDGAKLSSGDHIVKARAHVAGDPSDSDEKTASFHIQNPVSLHIDDIPPPTGPGYITGTVEFLDCISSLYNDGRTTLYRRLEGATEWEYYGYRDYKEPIVSFSHGTIDFYGWPSGTHEIRIDATGANQETISDYTTVLIDNPISITADIPAHPREPMDIIGTAQFIDSPRSILGRASLYRRQNGAATWEYYGQRDCEEPTSSFSFENIDIARYTNGLWDFKVIASLMNGSGDTKEYPGIVTVDNTPKLTARCPRYVSGDFDISGTAVFTEVISGTKGTLYINIDSQSTTGALTKTYAMGDPAGFTYSEIAGHMLNADTLGHGDHVAYIIAKSRYNNYWSDWKAVPFKTGPPEADGSGNIKYVPQQ